MHKATKHENDSSGWNGKKKKLFWKGNMGMNSLRKVRGDGSCRSRLKVLDRPSQMLFRTKAGLTSKTYIVGRTMRHGSE